MPRVCALATLYTVVTEQKRTVYFLLELLKLSESYQRTICSNDFRIHFTLYVHTHSHARNL